ncbi:transposable element Tcb1 transposase [Trichonephila clavipes]|nr:transposable element Tcb1 transposase [Trichonephila clavipes]
MAKNQSVRRHLDAFTRGRIIGKLEEVRSVTIVVVHEEPHPQMTGTLSYRPEETGGRQREKSLDTRHRRLDDRYRVLPWPEGLHGGGLFSRRPVRCVPLTPAHRRRRSLWCREHRNWRDNEWGRVLFTDESRFSLSSDSHRILIWRERGSRNHSLEHHSNGQVQSTGPVIVTRFFFHMCVFLEALWVQFLFMDDNAPCHRTVAAEQLLERRRLAARTFTTSNDSGASIGGKTNGQQCLNNSLTPSFSAWADAVKPA